MSGILYLIPNTLGPVDPNLADPLADIIPDNVCSVAAKLEYFIAENAKTARAFLKTVALGHPLERPLQEIRMAELNVNTDSGKLPDLLAPILDGADGGLISEAGVPAVADPGANLVRLAHAHKIRVRPLVGPSSLLLAVMASGLNGQSFAFNGYLPIDATERAKRIKVLEERSRQEKQTQVFIETPYRNGACLEALVNHLKTSTLVCVATNLSLASETITMQTAGRWKKDLAGGLAPDFQKKPSVFLILAE